MTLARFAPPREKAPATFKPALHALRGWAALLVVSQHVLAETGVTSEWLHYLNSSRGAVMLFFLISGYVIGHANSRPYAPELVPGYWRRRLLRLAPLYVVIVLFTLWVGHLKGVGTPWPQALGNLFGLQNFEPYGPVLIEPLQTNPVLWTLNYELIYYALFLAVWRWAPPRLPLIAACALLGACGGFLPGPLRIVGSLALGYVFWLTGLWLAWQAPSREHSKPFPFVGLLCLMIGTEEIVPFALFARALGRSLDNHPWLYYAELALLPACMLLIAGAVDRWPANPLPWCLAAMIPGWAGLLAALATHHSILEPRWFFSALFMVTGTALVWRPVGMRLLYSCLWAGGLSYALYLIHFPVRELYGYLFPDFSGAWLWVRLAVVTGCSLGLAALLEYRLQPAIVQAFNRAFHPADHGV